MLHRRSSQHCKDECLTTFDCSAIKFSRCTRDCEMANKKLLTLADATTPETNNVTVWTLPGMTSIIGTYNQVGSVLAMI